MTDATGSSKGLQRSLRRILAVTGALVCLLLATAWLALSLYLTSSQAARQVSHLLSDYLHSPVTVAGLRFSGGTIFAHGLKLASPRDFTERDLASVGSIEIRPNWPALLAGKKDFTGITVTGLRVTLARNGKGEWNFRDLARLPAARKGDGGGETTLRRLTVTDASLAVDGVAIDHLSLIVTDLTTRGTTDSHLLLACRDAGGTRIRLEGSARLGPDPALDVVLTAPEIYLKDYRRLVAGGRALDLAKGTGSLSVGLKFRNGKASATGRLGFDRVGLALGKGALLLKADLGFTGRYDSREDEASLDACSLSINDTLRLHIFGTVHQVKKARQFAAKVSLERMDLRRLVMLLPTEVRGGLGVAGDVSPADLAVAGDAEHGITDGKGAIRLSGAVVSREGAILARGLSAEVSLARGGAGWQASGRVSQGGVNGGDLLQALDARFSAVLSPRLKIVRAELSSFSAIVAGFPAIGRIGYLPGTAEPFSSRIAIGKAPVVAANSYLAGKNTAFSAGTLNLAIHASGKDPHDFKGDLHGGLADFKGDVAGKQIAIKEAAIDASFGVTGGRPSAAGKLDFRGTFAGSGTVALATGFGIADNKFSLTAGSVGLDRARVEFAGIRGALPMPAKEGAGRRIPLRIQLDGISARSGDALLSGMSGRISMDYRSGQAGQRLSGNGQFAVSDLSFRGKKIGFLKGRLESAEAGIIAQVDGTSLGGHLHGTATVDPFDQRKKTSFRFHIAGAKGTELTLFAPSGAPARISGGALDADLAGEYDVREGVSCRAAATAAGITLAGEGGKPLLSGGSFRTVAELKRDNLFIREGTVSAGDGATVTFKGEVAHVSSPSRLGTVSLALPEIPLATLLQNFGALLPDKFHTATAKGTVGGRGDVRIAARNAIFDGELSLDKGEFEAPDQQISLSDATGTIPVSLVLAGDAGGTKQVRLTYRKENFATLLEALRRAMGKGSNLTIGKIRFGQLEWRETSVGMKAENGHTEITALNSSILDGALLGAGYFHSGRQSRYGLDLIVADLSLRALCDAFPNIKGYISGKVDGIISLYGEGKGLRKLRGFTEIWTRSGPGEKMLVSKEFLQKLAGRKLKGLFFRNDRAYDRGVVRGYLESGYLTFEVLDIAHTNMFGIKDLSVSVAPVQNKISLDHLFTSVKAAATRGKAAAGGEGAAPAPAATEFKWQE